MGIYTCKNHKTANILTCPKLKISQSTPNCMYLQPHQTACILHHPNFPLSPAKPSRLVLQVMLNYMYLNPPLAACISICIYHTQLHVSQATSTACIFPCFQMHVSQANPNCMHLKQSQTECTSNCSKLHVPQATSNCMHLKPTHVSQIDQNCMYLKPNYTSQAIINSKLPQATCKSPLAVLYLKDLQTECISTYSQLYVYHCPKVQYMCLKLPQTT